MRGESSWHGKCSFNKIDGAGDWLSGRETNRTSNSSGEQNVPQTSVNSNGRPRADRSGGTSWAVEIHLSPGDVLSLQAEAASAEEAVEAVLASCSIPARKVAGISAQPVQNARAA